MLFSARVGGIGPSSSSAEFILDTIICRRSRVHGVAMGIGLALRRSQCHAWPAFT